MFCFFLALWRVGSCLPERGLNPHPLQPCSGKWSLSHWTRRKVPQYTLPLSMRLWLFISVVSVRCKCFGQCMPLCLPAPHKGSQAGSLKPIMVGSIHTMEIGKCCKWASPTPNCGWTFASIVLKGGLITHAGPHLLFRSPEYQEGGVTVILGARFTLWFHQHLARTAHLWGSIDLRQSVSKITWWWGRILSTEPVPHPGINPSCPVISDTWRTERPSWYLSSDALPQAMKKTLPFPVALKIKAFILSTHFLTTCSFAKWF